MNQYVTGSIIRRLREERGMTQQELARRLFVSEKTVSKWETGKGYPDITMLEELSAALGISVPELMAGEQVRNQNRSCNMRKLKFYVCPVCGNILTATGEAVISCCGIPLPPLECEECDAEHAVTVENVEDEYFVTVPHEMTKTHYITFAAAIRDDGTEIIKGYPEGNAEFRFRRSRTRAICVCCNRHGLFGIQIKPAPRRAQALTAE